MRLAAVSDDLRDILRRLKLAEDAVAAAGDDFCRFRNVVDSAGELALMARFHDAQEALTNLIRELDNRADVGGQRPNAV